tara:strand:- start:183 stop:776 length:594 start_codon:yes stop_codon:yes gene_type:complete
MTKKYMTKYQLEHLKKRVDTEIRPLIDEAKLLRKSVVADMTASAEKKLGKKIKADLVINELEKALENLASVQRKATTFFSKGATTKDLKENLSYKFTDKSDRTILSSGYNTKGIMPNDCREQLREWAEKLAIKEAEKTPEGQQVKKLELYRDSAVNSIFETGLPDDLPKTLEAIFKPLNIKWNKAEALQLENRNNLN